MELDVNRTWLLLGIIEGVIYFVISLEHMLHTLYVVY